MAKKSRGFSELVRQQKREKASGKSLEEFQRSVKRDFDIDLQTVTGQEGIAKMSDVLKDFIRPYDNIPKNMQEFRHLIETAVTAWDLALLPEEERIKMLDKICIVMLKESKNIDQEYIEISRTLIENLIARKLKYFADNQRRIIDFQVEDFGEDEYHLSVASTMPK
jgi:hypothetical protein